MRLKKNDKNHLKIIQQRLRKREDIEGEIVGIEVQALASAQLENIMKEGILITSN